MEMEMEMETPKNSPTKSHSTRHHDDDKRREQEKDNDETARNHQSQSQSESEINEEAKKRDPIASILNLVVDHAMMPPSPLEPDEFKWKYFPPKMQKQNGEDDTDANHEMDIDIDADLDMDMDMEANGNVKVPVIRIFGPIIRNKGMPLPTQKEASLNMEEGGEASRSNNSTYKSSQPLVGIKIHQSGCLHIHGAFPYMLARPVEAGADASSSFYHAYNTHNNRREREHEHEHVDSEEEDTSEIDAEAVVDWDDEESIKLITDEIHSKLEQALRSHFEHGYGGGPQSNQDREKQGQTNVSSQAQVQVRLIRQVTVVCGRGFYTFCNGGTAPFLKIEYYDPSHRWRVKIMLERGFEMPLDYHPKGVNAGRDGDMNGVGAGGAGAGAGAVAEDMDVDVLKFRCYEAHIPYTMQFFKDWNLAGMSWVNVGDGRFRTPIQRVVKDRCGNGSIVNRDSKQHQTKGVQDSPGDFYTMAYDTIPSDLHWTHHDDNQTKEDASRKNEDKTLFGAEFWTKKETSCDIELDTTVSNLLNVDNVMKTRPDDPEVHWRAVPSLREIWSEERKRMAHLLPPKENFLSEEKEEVVPSFTLSVKKGADKPGARLALEGTRQLFNSSPGLLEDFRRAMADIVRKHAEPLSNIDEKMKDAALRQREKRALHNTPSKKLFKSSQDEALAALESLMSQFSPEASIKSCSQLSSSQKPVSPIALSQKMSQSATQLSQADLREVEDDLEFCRKLERDDEHDSHIDPSTLTPYLDEAGHDFLDEEENMEEEEFEKCLTMLATQENGSSKLHVNPATDYLSESPMTSQSQRIDYEDLTPRDDCTNGSGDGHCFTQNSNDLQSPVVHAPSADDAVDGLATLVKEKKRISLTSDSSVEGTGNFLYLKRTPPLRGACRRSEIPNGSRDILWHPIKLNAVVPWLGYACMSRGLNLIESSTNVHACSAYLEPTRKPPSASRVRRWLLQKRKNEKIPEREKQPEQQQENQQHHTAISQHTSSMLSVESAEPDALGGIGQQGGKLYVEGGGTLKTSLFSSGITSPKSCPETQVTIMSIEVHVQCRIGRAGANNSREIAMQPDPSRDSVVAICYVYGYDPGGGEKIVVIERASVFVPTENEISSYRRDCDDDESRKRLISLVGKTMGCSKDLKIEVVANERQLLLRFASIVRWKDPDTLMSWDTQGLGIGYLIDRGLALGEKDNESACIDMVRLLGRTPKHDESKMEKNCYDRLFDEHENDNGESKAGGVERTWAGSGLGAEWDDRIGAGSGPASIVGRLVLNCRKIMSDEVKHPNNSYQPAVVSTVLKRRIPFHDDLVLTKWYGGNKGAERWRVLKHRISQALANIKLFDALDVIGRAGEAARLSGVELSQSFPGIRGSQYKVEGVLLRALQSLWSDEQGEKKGKRQLASSLSDSSQGTASQSQSPWKVRRNSAKPILNDTTEENDQRGYFFFSPSKRDAALQEALECQAMTLEPQSGFHFDPVVVCDFTALYPSLIIAYNLCYSTCAGKLEYHSTRKEMRQKGKTTSKLGPFHYPEPQTAYTLKQHVKSLSGSTFAKSTDRAYCLPTGSIFVSERVLRGVLPSVLDEILATRAMLKKAAKQYKRLLAKPPKAVLRQLEARQLALKYVANVTYGYTSATFSGRSAMPLLADSIVECGRRTLTNAIMLANKWGSDKSCVWSGAHVVYGDTDSIFVKLPGRTVKEAWAFGKEFCDKVTASNPPPVQLKLEKVYLGTLLQTKKKYCGMKFDSPDQQTPTFEAKGIETIRKDQCALTQKILRDGLIKIFNGEGIDHLKHYLFRQWALVHAGRFPVSDFILTGRVRSQYRGKVGPVQAALAKRLAEADPGRTIRHKERLPYVIVASPGRNFKLRDCVLTPDELLAQWDAYTVHSQYYATKHLNAALNRCFSLDPFKIDINVWYQAAPKPQKRIHNWPITRAGNSTMISSYFGSDICAICFQKSKTDGAAKAVICNACKGNSNITSYLALRSLNKVQKEGDHLASICQQCNGCVENSGTYATEKIIARKSKSTISSKRKIQFSTATGSCSRGVVAPISICTCIDCPVTYKRHRARELEIEALDLCNALRLLEYT